MAVSSQKEAKALVAQIAKDHGYLGDEIYARMEPDIRQQVMEALLTKDGIIGSSVITLAKNLYTKDVRFIFELLQNADDNLFTDAENAGTKPSVEFRVFHDRIVVECNENGFSEANLRAICNVGKSSKKGGQAYIGEKGIGFKSVFKVAWKVHIQSGYFSFCFKHRRGDSGMGMISPEWEESAGNLDGPLTRMTFFLHDDGDAAHRATIRQNVTEQLNDLQPAMLLFLKRLKVIRMMVFDDGGRKEWSCTLSKSQGDAQSGLNVLETARETRGQDVERKSQRFHVTRETVNGLPQSENREYSSEEEAAKAYSKAEVVLAFPLTDQNVPVIEPQELFAFLPIRRAGFNFLMHSDFVTLANREDIVTTSPRNLALRNAIPDVFITAVRQMCDQPTLQFQWIRYLPMLATNHWDHFWTSFIFDLKKKIGNLEVLVSRCPGLPRRSPRQLRFLHDRMLDQHGDPIFPDLPFNSAVYISKDYQQPAIKILKTCGLKEVDNEQIIARAAYDLSRPKATSKMKSPDTDANWHSRAAKLLHAPFRDKDGSLEAKVKELPLLPLSTKTWASVSDGATHFSTTSEGVPIPEAVDVALIDPIASACNDRKTLFQAIGITFLTTSDVRAKILHMYDRGKYYYLPSLGDSVSLLKFLHLSQPENGSRTECRNISLHAHNSYQYRPNRVDMFFQEQTVPYSPSKLGLAVEFVHPDYLASSPVQQTPGVGTTKVEWKEWLHCFMQVRRHLRLIARDDVDSLSNEVLHVAEHMPSKFLGLLRHLWPHEKDQASTNDVLCSKVARTLVLCEGGEQRPLEGAILPTARLKLLASKYTEEGETMPFLQMESTSQVSEERLAGWKFLNHFAVIQTDSLSFYLEMIKTITTANPRPDQIRQPSRVLGLYVAIHGKTGEFDVEESRGRIRRHFERFNAIYLRQQGYEGDDTTCWSAPSQCLLDAPLEMRSKRPIDSIYADIFRDAMELPSIKLFLRDTLGIPRCSWINYVEELRYLKTRPDVSPGRVQTWYQYLQREDLTILETRELRQVFSDEDLIFVLENGRGSWHKAPDCVWSTAISGVRGKANLASQYSGSELQPFFVSVVGVDMLNVRMVFDDLLGMTPQQNAQAVQDVKHRLESLSSLLGTESLSEERPPGLLLDRPIWPVRQPGGRVLLQTGRVHFAVIDRKDLEEKFASSVRMLDFTMREAHDLKPLLEWAGLEDRFLSRMVKETRILGSGTKYAVSDPKYDIKNKAHGLLRIAAHFKSPRVFGDGEELYALLRGSETWETDGISSRLAVEVDGRTITVDLDQSDVFIDDNDDTTPLRIYIPFDEAAQDICMQTSLPQLLTEWILAGQDDGSSGPNNTGRGWESAVAIVQGILNVRPASVAEILLRNGITEADVPNRDLEGDNSRGSAAAPPAPSTPTRSPALPARSPAPPLIFTPEASQRYPGWEPDTPATDPDSLVVRATAEEDYFASPGVPEAHCRRRNVQELNTAYCRLLSHVVAVAHRSRIPTLDASDVSSLRAALVRHQRELDMPAPPITTSGFSDSINEGFFMIGAAGELFIFEFLSKLALPGFDENNWTSNIKRYVLLHPDYQCMGPWSGREVTDLQYHDTSGSFTALLIENGYLAADEWEDKTPMYYFEVKSTPQECNAAFYMSGSQYESMRALSTENSIYIIFRVFQLYTNRLDFKIYVNPLELQRQGQLKFITDKYTVRATV